MLFLELLYAVFLYTVFGASHSYLAGFQVKQWVAGRFPAWMPYYRALYNVVAIVSFFFILSMMPDLDYPVYDLQYPLDLLVLVPQFISLGLLVWTVRYIDVMEFAGIAQIIRHWRHQYRTETLDEESVLRIKGPYKISRHPIYLFTILFLAFRPVMDVQYLVFLVSITAYFYIGAFFEEKRLTTIHGSAYMAYQETTPMIFPGFFSFKRIR